MYFVPSFALRGIDSLIEQYGVDPVGLMLAAGFAPELLDKPDNMVSGQQCNDLMEYAARQLNQRFFGLQLAKIQGATILGPLWFLLRSSPTIEDSIKSLLKNYPSHTEVTLFSVEQYEQGMTLIYDVHPEIQGDHTQIIELGLAISCMSFRRYIGPSWSPRAMYFEGVEPYEKRPLIDLFGDKLYFEQENNGILLTTEELKLPIRESSHLERQHYDHEAVKFKDLNPRSTLLQTESIINASLTKHHCSLDFVAKCLGLKPRTLQYQLQQQGTNFQTLLQQAKLNFALRLLQQSNLSITEIAQRLQFSELAVFTRFIKKYTGKTPKQLR